MEFSATLDDLPKVMEYLHKEALQMGVDEKLIHKIELACEEAIVNVILYAYPEKKGKIQVFCQRKGKRLEVELKDHGVAFNPIDVDINPQTDIPVHDRKVGGLGIFLLRKIIDEAIYQREDETNVLRLVFNV